MNLKDEHTSRLWTFIMKGEIMAFELDDDEMIATRVNNKAASWKEVEEYIEKYYVKKDKIREIIKDLDEFDTSFYNIETLKLVTKNTLQELLEERN